jgi:hypothetical protein
LCSSAGCGLRRCDRERGQSRFSTVSPIVLRRSRSGPGTGWSDRGTSYRGLFVGEVAGDSDCAGPNQGSQCDFSEYQTSRAAPPAARAARVPCHPRRANDDSPDLHDAGGVWSVGNKFGPGLRECFERVSALWITRRCCAGWPSTDERFAEGCVAGGGVGSGALDPKTWRGTVLRSRGRCPGECRVDGRRVRHRESAASPDGSIEGVDRIRHCETERGDDPDQLAAVLERLGHHRVGQHGEDRTCRKRQDERDGVG